MHFSKVEMITMHMTIEIKESPKNNAGYGDLLFKDNLLIMNHESVKKVSEIYPSRKNKIINGVVACWR